LASRNDLDTTFAQWGHFQRAAFFRLVTFSGATFSEEANFDEAIFCRRADFGKGSAITSFCGISSLVSYLLPFAAIVVVSIIGAGVFWYFDARSFGEALALSAANALNIFGFRRDFGLETCTPLAWLKVFSAIQTVLGAILLFLVGLGIRNKFRMK
jgi:hypothetical protein